MYHLLAIETADNPSFWTRSLLEVPKDMKLKAKLILSRQKRMSMILLIIKQDYPGPVSHLPHLCPMIIMCHRKGTCSEIS